MALGRGEARLGWHFPNHTAGQRNPVRKGYCTRLEPAFPARVHGFQPRPDPHFLLKDLPPTTNQGAKEEFIVGTTQERIQLANLFNRAVNLEEIGRMDRARKLLREAEAIIQNIVYRTRRVVRGKA